MNVAASLSENYLTALAPLDHLARARMSVAEYYLPLADYPDEVLRVAAYYAMISRKELPFDRFEGAIEMSRYGAIRGAAFDFFQNEWEHGFAARAVAQPSESEAVSERAQMLAEIDADGTALADVHRQRYLATGDADHLLQEERHAYLAGGAGASLAIAVRNVVASPHDPGCAVMLMQRCVELADPALVDAAIDRFESCGLHAFIAWINRASAALLKGDARAAIAQLDSRPPPPPRAPDVVGRLRVLAARIRAQALDQLGDYPAAYRAYVEMNRPNPGETIDTTTYRSSAASAGTLPVPHLPPDPKRDWLVMTGFARSGTTLLENALAAHPEIETYEELPVRQVVMNYLGRTLASAKTEADRRELFLAARKRYYTELARHSRKPGARIHIDKQPMRTADARFMAKLYPDKRYIFSIRHPFDVVLSCFRQDFARNIAMDSFRSFDSAVSLYDFAMGEWFASHGLDDPKVHYLRYDDLVLNFEASIRATLAFLGVEWNDAVADFAIAAQNRSARTPSYQKVRQGVSIGVQSSWRNYRFLFDTPAAKPLYKWAEFFGYDTK